MVKIEKEKCTECRICITLCPVKAFRLADDINTSGYHPAVYILERCQGCALCAIMCPAAAIEVSRA